jgi:seryl-tRNA synthetase
MLTLKLSDEQMKTLGISTEKEAYALLESSKASADALTGKTKDVTDLRSDLGKMAERITALESRKVELSATDKAALVTELKGSPEILAAVKSAAQTETTSVLAKFGGKPVGQGENKADVTDPAKGKEIAANDYKAQWEADANLRAEFLDNFKSYESYMRMNADGRAKITTK